MAPRHTPWLLLSALIFHFRPNPIPLYLLKSILTLSSPSPILESTFPSPHSSGLAVPSCGWAADRRSQKARSAALLQEPIWHDDVLHTNSLSLARWPQPSRCWMAEITREMSIASVIVTLEIKSTMAMRATPGPSCYDNGGADGGRHSDIAEHASLWSDQRCLQRRPVVYAKTSPHRQHEETMVRPGKIDP